MTRPNFIVIGAAKSGTTALYHYLLQHPEVYMSPTKEPNYFLFQEIQYAKDLNPHDHYEAKFFELALSGSTTTSEAYETLFDGVTKEIAVGEASPGYLHAEQVPKRIFQYNPTIKLIALLRHPVERALSHFLFFLRLGVEPTTDFSKAIRSQNWRTERYIMAGLYYRSLQRYYALFDSRQIRVYLYDEFMQSPEILLHDLYRFLEIDFLFEPDMSVKYNVSGVPKSQLLDDLIWRLPSSLKNRIRPIIPKRLETIIRWINNKNLTKPALAPDIRKYLLNTFRDDTLKLQDLIGRDLSHWLE